MLPRRALLISSAIVLLLSGVSVSQAAEPPFAKQYVSETAASRGRYSDLVTVSGSSRTLFIWGVGAEEENSTTQYAPDVRFRGNFAGQCGYAMEKIGRMLATRAATLADVTTLRVYLTDGRNTADLYKCLDQSYPVGAPRPAVTTANISQLAHAGMMVEIEATASLPGASGNASAGPAFSIFRNTETLGKWNLGATEVLEVSGTDRTFYFSGLRAVENRPGQGVVAMYPQDFVSQCGVVQRKMKALLQAEGAAIDNVIRSTTFVTGDVRQPDSARCRAQLPKEDVVRVPGTLLNVPQLGAPGETFTYDIIGMAPLRTAADGTKFAKKIVASDVDPAVPDVVIVSGPRRTLNIAGVGSQDDAGAVQARGDFIGQCKLAMQKIDVLLARQDIGVDGIAKMLVFVTDSRYLPDYKTCMKAVFSGRTQPAQTFVNVARLPEPGMLIQIDATAVTAR